MPYSSKWKIFWYTPARTASRSCSIILDYLGFESPRDHRFFSEDEHKLYYLICNVRNPYSRLFSLYTLKRKKETNLNFDEWLKLSVHDNKSHGGNLNEFYPYNFFWEKKRYPDYVIKVESLYEDISKLLFINQNQSEELDQIISDNILKNNYIPMRYTKIPWFEHYNEELADLVKINFEKDFELFGYDINSWKNGTP